MKLKRVWLVKLIFVLAFALFWRQGKDTTASDADKPFYKNAMVNTYVYDEKGKRTKDKKILAGKAVGCYSMINYVGDKPYIMIGQNKYVAYMNVVGLDCQLNHNSYIYSSSGKRIKNSGVLLKNGSVTVYGGKKKINGSKYWAIGVGLYVKASNVETLRAKSLVIQTRRTKQLNRKHLKLEHCICSAFLFGGDTISLLANSSNNTYYVKLSSEIAREDAA